MRKAAFFHNFNLDSIWLFFSNLMKINIDSNEYHSKYIVHLTKIPLNTLNTVWGEKKNTKIGQNIYTISTNKVCICFSCLLLLSIRKFWVNLLN